MSDLILSRAAVGGRGGGELLARGGGPAGSVGAAAERFARLTLAQAPQTQRTYRGSLDRFATWLAGQHAELHGHTPTVVSQAPVEAITADAVADYLTELEQRGLSVSTIRKDRAAINGLAKYLHALRLIDATEILMMRGPRTEAGDSTRDSLDAETWGRVLSCARAYAHESQHGPARAIAARDLAVITLLGGCGLRNEEVRALPTDAVFQRGRRAWLRVTGKGRRRREFPLSHDALAALQAWATARPEEVAGHPLMFPRLGRPNADGQHGRAATVPPTREDRGKVSSESLRKIVAPAMRVAGVPEPLCHAHVLRHTFATLYMQRDGARLEQLQELMGHAEIGTTRAYLHVGRAELEADIDRRDAASLL